MEITRSALAQLIDHTLLKPDATHEQVSALIAEARERHLLGVRLALDATAHRRPRRGEGGDGVRLPSGNHTPRRRPSRRPRRRRTAPTRWTW